MGEHRTSEQREADDIDLELFNLSRSLERFAERYGASEIDDASRIVFGLRGRVQRRMHKDDIEKPDTPTPGDA